MKAVKNTEEDESEKLVEKENSRRNGQKKPSFSQNLGHWYHRRQLQVNRCIDKHCMNSRAFPHERHEQPRSLCNTPKASNHTHTRANCFPRFVQDSLHVRASQIQKPKSAWKKLASNYESLTAGRHQQGQGDCDEEVKLALFYELEGDTGNPAFLMMWNILSSSVRKGLWPTLSLVTHIHFNLIGSSVLYISRCAPCMLDIEMLHKSRR